jgi:hypothetical protein
MSLSLSDIAPELRAASRQFEQWRRIRQPGDRIPDRLWKTAVAAARRYGVSRTAGLLHLEAGKLKQLMTGARPGPQPSPPPTFVELLAPSATGSGECTVEIEGPRGGRVRVQLRGALVPDLVALARVVWGAGT